jgi:AcrR family transcriptional regulator
LIDLIVANAKTMSDERSSAPAISRPAGRKAGERTRERMLDAAEELFALRGYDGTSMRNVAERAGVGVALLTYHFGTKEILFDRVVERRSSNMALLRIRALDEARRESGDQPIPIRRLVEGYVWPFVERSTHGGAGWKYYSQLIARLANSPSWGRVISDHYDAVARQYLIEFRRTIPNAPEADLYHAFAFMVGTMLAIVAEPGRTENLSYGKVDGADLEAVFSVMVPFLEGGFGAIRKGSKK